MHSHRQDGHGTAPPPYKQPFGSDARVSRFPRMSHTVAVFVTVTLALMGGSAMLTGVASAAAPSVAPVSSVSDGMISWQPVSGATSFTGAGRTTTYQSLGNVTSWSPTPQPDKTVYYGVASNGPNGGQWSTEVAIAWPPAAAVLTLHGTKISWPSDPNVTTFTGAISTAPQGSAGRTTTYQSLGNVTSWSPTPQPGKTVYYGVGANGPNGGQWSNTEVAIIWPPPVVTPPATVTTPVVTVKSGELSWSAVTSASSYTVAISNGPQSLSTRTTSYVVVGNVLHYTPSAVPGATMYYGVSANVGTWAGEVSIAWPSTSPVVPPVIPPVTTGAMMVGLNAGWGSISADDMAGVFTLARIDTTEGGTELPSVYAAKGIQVIPMFPGDVGGGYDSGGVSAINIPNWVNMVTAYYANQCSASTNICPAMEILNEPNGSWFWGANAEDATNESAYGALVTAVYNGFHAKYGAASPKILLAYDDPTWWAGIVAGNPNIRSYFDGAIVHPYGGTGSVASSALGDRALVTQAHNDTGKPVWATEVGWPTAVGQPATGDSLQWTQTQQAANIYNFVNWARSTGYVASVLYFNYRDYGTNNSYGVESSTGAKKPGWYALAEAANEQPCTVC
jgi:hypothetical protein